MIFAIVVSTWGGVTTAAAYITSENVSETVSAPSEAITFSDKVPTSAAAGVPLKVRVELVKVSQLGSTASLAYRAV